MTIFFFFEDIILKEEPIEVVDNAPEPTIGKVKDEPANTDNQTLVKDEPLEDNSITIKHEPITDTSFEDPPTNETSGENDVIDSSAFCVQGLSEQ